MAKIIKGPPKSLTAVAREGYAIWRGTFPVDAMAPPHWDDLTERERMGFKAVAAYATVQTIENVE